jgi:hypothetical protein
MEDRMKIREEALFRLRAQRREMEYIQDNIATSSPAI